MCIYICSLLIFIFIDIALSQFCLALLVIQLESYCKYSALVFFLINIIFVMHPWWYLYLLFISVHCSIVFHSINILKFILSTVNENLDCFPSFPIMTMFLWPPWHISPDVLAKSFWRAMSFKLSWPISTVINVYIINQYNSVDVLIHKCNENVIFFSTKTKIAWEVDEWHEIQHCACLLKSLEAGEGCYQRRAPKWLKNTVLLRWAMGVLLWWWFKWIYLLYILP